MPRHRGNGCGTLCLEYVKPKLQLWVFDLEISQAGTLVSGDQGFSKSMESWKRRWRGRSHQRGVRVDHSGIVYQHRVSKHQNAGYIA